jgi:sugar lactone lactonase YvrE
MTLQFRRGTDSDRLTITPSAGEPIWTTDTEKLYVGDGSTAGGILATGGTGGTDSATVSSIITATVDSAYINARTDANLDSASTLNLINAAYIQANQITYNTSDFADSAFVTAQINNLIDGAPGTLDTLNEIAAALNDDDSAYTTLVNLINAKSDLDSADALNLINASYIQSNQITYNTSDFADSAFVTSQINAISIPTLGNDFVDSAQVQSIVDSAYVQLRQIAGGTDSATVSSIIAADVDSAYIQARQSTVSSGATTITTFNYEADSGQTTFSGADIDGSSLTYTSGKLNVYLNGILLVDSNDYTATNGTSVVLNTAADSADTLTVISYITQAVGTLDSTGVTNLIDAAYINARVSATDSATVSAIIAEDVDSAYVQARQITYTIPTLGNDFVDSGQVTNIVDASYIQSNQTTYNTSDFADSAFVTSQIAAISIPTLGNDFVDSAQVQLIVDSAYVQLRQSTVSGGATTITTFNYEADSGQTTFSGTDIDGSTLSYTSGKLNVYLNGILLIDSNDYTATNGTSVVLNTAADSADTVTVISYITQAVGTLDSTGVTNLIDAAYINARVSATDSATVSAIVAADVDSAYVQARQITYTIPTLGNDFVDSSAARGLLSGGTGVTYNSSTGEISIGQAVGTTDSAVFASLQTTGNVIVGGNLQVTGTTTTVNSEDLNVTDHMIYMNAGESAGSPTASIDVGWAANVNDNGSYTHVGMFRDATDDTFKVFGNYTPEPDAAAEINTGHASFALAPFAASTLTGEYLGFDSDVTAAGLATQSYVTALPVSTFTNDTNYLDSTTVQGVINASYIQSNQTTYNTSDFADSAFVTSQIAAISIPTLGNDFVDSAQVTAIVDSAYVQLRQAAAAAGGTDSATVISLIQSTVDSAYVQLRDGVNDSSSLFTDKVRLSEFTADSGQTTFTGLNYTSGKIQVFLNGILLKDSDDYTATNGTSVSLTSGADSGNVLSIVGYETLPVAAATTITTFNYEADSGQTTFSGADIDGASLTYTAGKLNVYLNGILLIDSNDYTATNGSSIVLNTAADSADTLSVISYITQQVGTLDSTGVTNLIDSAYIQARQSASSSFDSAAALALINASYIQSNQTTYNTSDFADSAFVTSQIAAISIPTLGNDFVDSGQVTNIVNASYIQSNQTTYNTSDFADSAFVTSQIAAISIPTLGNDFVDSAQVQSIVDSAYVQLRQSSSGSSSTFDLEASNRANYGWYADLSSATNTGTYIFGFGGAGTFNGIFWSTDGSYLFECDGDTDLIRRITVPTPYDISSVTTPYDTSNQIDTSSENNYTEDLWFSPDGLRLVILGSYSSTDHAVHSYTLTSPWDLTTATYDSKTINVNSTGGGGVAGIHLSPDGRKMFIASNSTDKVHEYTLSTAYDVSTATETRTLDISSQTGGASGIRFNHQGTQMFISDSSNGVIVYQYKLTLPFNVSSASYVTSHTGSSGSGTGKGLAFTPDGAYLHTVGNGRVYEITLTGNVSYATPVVSKDVLAYDSNLQDFVDTFTLPTSDGSASQVLVTNGSGTLSFAAQSGGLDSALITQLIDSAYVQLRQSASGGGGGSADSATINTLIDAKLQVADVTDFVGADGNAGQLLKSLGNGETAWTDFKLSEHKPSSNTASGAKGELTFDSAHLYMCIATNTWRRIAWTDSSW